MAERGFGKEDGVWRERNKCLGEGLQEGRRWGAFVLYDSTTGRRSVLYSLLLMLVDDTRGKSIRLRPSKRSSQSIMLVETQNAATLKPTDPSPLICIP